MERDQVALISSHFCDPFPPFRHRDTLRLERMNHWMSRQAESDQPSSEYANFESALKKVLSVPRSEMLEKLNATKKPGAASLRFFARVRLPQSFWLIALDKPLLLWYSSSRVQLQPIPALT